MGALADAVHITTPFFCEAVLLSVVAFCSHPQAVTKAVER
jgi:hypothetical protein